MRESWLRDNEGSMFEEKSNQLVELAFATFQELKPVYQEYIPKQIDLLLEIQREEEESE